MRSLSFAAFVWVALAMPPAGHAREIEGVDFPEEVDVGGHTVKLVGVGLRSKWFFNVYAMGVYQRTPRKSAAHLVRSNEPKFLWIRMLRTIGAGKMHEAIDEGIEKNQSEERRAALKDRIEAFKGFFSGKLRKGTDVGISYLPGQGTIVRIGGEQKGVVAGADFMRALWAIWFGRRPADKDLKKRVLAAD